MRNGELRGRLDQIAARVRDEFTPVTAVTASPLTDSTGDDAVRFEVTLSDPPGGKDVRFQLASEAREIEAGTYFG